MEVTVHSIKLEICELPQVHTPSSFIFLWTISTGHEHQHVLAPPVRRPTVCERTANFWHNVTDMR